MQRDSAAAEMEEIQGPVGIRVQSVADVTCRHLALEVVQPLSKRRKVKPVKFASLECGGWGAHTNPCVGGGGGVMQAVRSLLRKECRVVA